MIISKIEGYNREGQFSKTLREFICDVTLMKIVPEHKPMPQVVEQKFNTPM